MLLQTQTLASLFAQLGLPDDELSIKRFIHQHEISPEKHIYQAPFWTPSQSAFLQEAISDDAEWAEVIDQLDNMLRPEF